MNDVGYLSRFLGCAFERDKAKGAGKMTQTAFIDWLVERFDIWYKSQTSASVYFDLGPKRSDEKEGGWPYKKAGGGLLWIMGMTRPNIASAVKAVAQHAHNPPARDWKAMCKVITYHKGTKGLGDMFWRGWELKLSLYVDADYADRCDGIHSVSSVAVVLGDICDIVDKRSR